MEESESSFSEEDSSDSSVSKVSSLEELQVGSSLEASASFSLPLMSLCVSES